MLLGLNSDMIIMYFKAEPKISDPDDLDSDLEIPSYL